MATTFFGLGFSAAAAELGTIVVPVLSAPNVKNVMHEGAQIVWTTDLISDSRVVYGTVSGDYPYSATMRCDAGGLVVSHCVNLTGLVSNTTYYYRVKSSTSGGVEGRSAEGSFVSATYASSTTMTAPSTTSNNTGSGTTSSGSSGLGEGTSPNTSSGDTAQTTPNQATTTAAEPQTSPTTQTATPVATEPVPAVTQTTPATETNATVVQPAHATTTVRVAVADSSGAVVASASVRAYNPDTQTGYTGTSDAYGIASFSLPLGTYYFEAYPPASRGDVTKAFSKIAFTTVSGGYYTVPLTLAIATKTIYGSVLFGGAAPVADAEVGAYNADTSQWTSVSTDGTGAYSLVVSNGTWQIGIRPRSGAAFWTYENAYPKVSFSGSGKESQRVDFEIPLTRIADATLVIVAADDTGTPQGGVGVMLDTGSVTVGTETRTTFFATTSPSGVASFKVRAGIYHVRASLPPARGYVVPPEVSVTALAGKSVATTVIFKRYAVVQDRYQLSGRVTLDGKGTTAFIWGWSNSGEHWNSRAAEDGTFTAPLSRNTYWHIGAGKELDGAGYRSTEITVGTMDVPVPQELALERVTRPLPREATVSQASSGEAVAQTSDGAKLTLPPNAAVAGGGSITLAINPTVEVPNQPVARVVGLAYDITVTDQFGAAVTSLAAEAQITLPYDPAQLTRYGITEKALAPSYFDEKTGVWVKVDKFTVDTKNHVLVLSVNHLTRFVIVAYAADITPPAAPTLTAATFKDGLVRVSWKNPIADFDHAKVYRSSEAGKLGQIRAPEVLGELFADADVQSAVTYYYTVRSVDPAGNESSNQSQLKVTTGNVTVPAAPVKVEKVAITATLKRGSRGEQVTALQGILISLGLLSADSMTGYFGPLTHTAVIRFQEKYTKDILAPVGLTKGTGIVGTFSRAKLNAL